MPRIIMPVKSQQIMAFRRCSVLSAVFIGIQLFTVFSMSTANAAYVRHGSHGQESHRSDAIPVEASAAMSDYVHALLLDMKGDYWGAIDILRKVMAQRPTDAAVRYSMSRSWYRLAVLDSARVHGEAAVRIDPSNRHYLRHLAGIAHDMRDYNRSAELYGLFSQAVPGRTDIMYMQGLEFLSANQPEQALEVFKKAMRIDPYNEAALSHILFLETGLRRYPEAIETAKRLIKPGGGDRKLRITLAELYARNGQDTLAVQTLHELIAADRSSVSSWIALFDYYIKAGRNHDFQRELAGFLDTASSSPESLHDLGRLYISRSTRDSLYVGPAVDLLEEMIGRRPHDSELFMLKGLYGLMHQRQQDGLASLNRAVRLDPGNVSAWEYLISASFDQGEKRQAFDLLAKARRRLPRQYLRWRTIEGNLLLYSGSPARASVILEAVARSKTKDQEILIQANTSLAMAYELLGRKRRCREVYEMVIELDPHNTLAMNNLAYLLAEDGIMLQQALRLASNAVLLEPENGVYLDTLGWVHYKLGNYELARQSLEKALAAGVDEGEIYQHMGEVYKKLGDEAKATEMFGKAKSTGNKKR
jgi:tetratricopeptide (TPR) repeat protein